jgi:hypothetical protein
MNRRSMLSFLGIGAVGASTIGAQSGMNPVPSTHGTTYDIGYSIAKESYSTPMVEDRATALKRMQDDLFGITSDPSKWIADRLAEEMKDWRFGYSNVRYNDIDPDIRYMKSITETAKMRMYFERKVKRHAEMQQTSLTGRIAEYLGVKV